MTNEEEYEEKRKKFLEEWNRKKDDLWQITLTREQLNLISALVEDCTRFASGQTEMWNTISRLELPTDTFCDLRDELNKLHPLVVPELASSSNASFGWSGAHCPRPSAKKIIAQGYMIYREILHQIAKEENWDNVYRGSTLTCPEQGRMIEVKKLPKKDDKKE